MPAGDIPYPWPHWYPAFSTAFPQPQIGCICPPGANKECERPDCPRRNLLNTKDITS